MARIRLPFSMWAYGFGVNAPSYGMVMGSVQPIIPGVTHVDGILPGILVGDPRLAGVTVQVDVPDEDVLPDKSALDHDKIKRRYPDHWLVTSGVIK